MGIQFSINESKFLKGVWIIKPSVSMDIRGEIWTSFINNEIESLIPNDINFIHDKFSVSKNNVLRGIHGDNKTWKLVTCVYGQIFQVVVDCRKKSNTYMNWEKFIIKQDDPLLILIPPDMGNAFHVTSEIAVYHYKLAYNGDYIDAKDQFSLKWNDPKINIDWPTTNPILSERDK